VQSGPGTGRAWGEAEMINQEEQAMKIKTKVKAGDGLGSW
jgi:hypothetical protein